MAGYDIGASLSGSSSSGASQSGASSFSGGGNYGGTEYGPGALIYTDQSGSIGASTGGGGLDFTLILAAAVLILFLRKKG